ncbi:unnamed protein product, partial [Amoebophrya sp. A25]
KTVLVWGKQPNRATTSTSNEIQQAASPQEKEGHVDEQAPPNREVAEAIEEWLQRELSTRHEKKRQARNPESGGKRGGHAKVPSTSTLSSTRDHDSQEQPQPSTNTGETVFEERYEFQTPPAGALLSASTGTEAPSGHAEVKIGDLHRQPLSLLCLDPVTSNQRCRQELLEAQRKIHEEECTHQTEA